MWREPTARSLERGGPQPLLPPVISFRRLVAEDISFAQELRALAGWNQTDRDWLGYLEFEPDGCLLAEVDGKRAGTATTIRYGDRVGWIGMVLVHPDHRRRGIGSELLNRSIDYLRTHHTRCIKLDATPMGRPVYLPLGFRDEYALHRYEGIAPQQSRGACNGVSTLQPDDLASLVEFDRIAFGADRARVVAALHQRDPSLCLAAKRGAATAGYLMARAGTNAIQLGPWLAESADVASDLIQGLFARIPGQRLFVDVPESNTSAEEILSRHGFNVQRPLTRMYLGANTDPGELSRIYGTSGAEKG